MDFKVENDKLREFYKQDFSQLNALLKRVRHSLATGNKLQIPDIKLSGIIDFQPNLTFTYITLFQAGQKSIRWGSKRKTLEETLNRNIDQLKNNKNFQQFNVTDENSCRIMIEYVTERIPTALKELNQDKFCENRFEIGVTGLEFKNNGLSYYYMPTDAIVLSHMGLRAALETTVKKTPIGKMTNSISERMHILKNSDDYEYFLIKTHAFVTFKDEIVPLYRGNTLYDAFSYDIVLEQFTKSCDWLVENQHDDGKFLYYYDAKEDNFKDHEHTTRKEDNLYYNDLRHCGGIVTLIRAYTQTKDEKYLNAAKKAMDFSASISAEHKINGKKAYFCYYNAKGKLGGTGLALIAFMQYRIITGDKSYDKFITGYVRHLISRVYKNGEMLGYYIHPDYQKGRPLLKMSDKERKETFSFYYPGEALLGLALFANHFDEDEEKLIQEVRKSSKKALLWLVNERPKVYKDLFTALPSDAWLMQAIEEWTNDTDFIIDDLINFVFTDANTLMQKMYKKDDNPYIDYEGGYFYNYGDHYFPDGARSEGLISAYYLAKKLGKEDLATDMLKSAKLAAKSQFSLFNTEKSNYAHKNPARSYRGIRFKATRQWVRVDSIQHVACFFIRLYLSENK